MLCQLTHLADRLTRRSFDFQHTLHGLDVTLSLLLFILQNRYQLGLLGEQLWLPLRTVLFCQPFQYADSLLYLQPLCIGFSQRLFTILDDLVLLYRFIA
ncbi:hypothetical protein D9M73_181860 [compost metagenome]